MNIYRVITFLPLSGDTEYEASGIVYGSDEVVIHMTKVTMPLPEWVDEEDFKLSGYFYETYEEQYSELTDEECDKFDVNMQRDVDRVYINYVNMDMSEEDSDEHGEFSDLKSIVKGELIKQYANKLL